MLEYSRAVTSTGRMGHYREYLYAIVHLLSLFLLLVHRVLC